MRHKSLFRTPRGTVALLWWPCIAITMLIIGLVSPADAQRMGTGFRGRGVYRDYGFANRRSSYPRPSYSRPSYSRPSYPRFNAYPPRQRSPREPRYMPGYSRYPHTMRIPRPRTFMHVNPYPSWIPPHRAPSVGETRFVRPSVVPRQTSAPVRQPTPSVAVPPVIDARVAPDEMLIVFRSTINAARVRQFEARHGLIDIERARIELLGAEVRRYRLQPGTSLADRLAQVSADRIVARAQPHYLFDLQDDQQGGEPAPATTAAPSQYAVDVLHLPDAHKLATGLDVRVAVIDSGIDETNPDLAGTVIERFDALGEPFKPHPHGTAMAGAIVAHRTLVGVAPEARLIAIRAFSGSGGQTIGMGFNILRGLDFAATHGARVVNMSFAGPEDRLLEDAIAAARLRGILVIAAAGNGGPGAKPMFPAAAPGALAVTASDPDNKPFVLANRGAYVAVAAPGVNVIAPGIGDTVQLTSGTSIATAEASGVVALLLQRHPDLKPDEICKILATTAHKAAGDSGALGAGVLDAHAAVAGLN